MVSVAAACLTGRPARFPIILAFGCRAKERHRASFVVIPGRLQHRSRNRGLECRFSLSTHSRGSFAKVVRRRQSIPAQSFPPLSVQIRGQHFFRRLLMWADCRQHKSRDRNAIAALVEAESRLVLVKVLQSCSHILETEPQPCLPLSPNAIANDYLQHASRPPRRNFDPSSSAAASHPVENRIFHERWHDQFWHEQLPRGGGNYPTPFQPVVQTPFLHAEVIVDKLQFFIEANDIGARALQSSPKQVRDLENHHFGALFLCINQS